MICPVGDLLRVLPPLRDVVVRPPVDPADCTDRDDRDGGRFVGVLICIMLFGILTGRTESVGELELELAVCFFGVVAATKAAPPPIATDDDDDDAILSSSSFAGTAAATAFEVFIVFSSFLTWMLLLSSFLEDSSFFVDVPDAAAEVAIFLL